MKEKDIIITIIIDGELKFIHSDHSKYNADKILVEGLKSKRELSEEDGLHQNYDDFDDTLGDGIYCYELNAYKKTHPIMSDNSYVIGLYRGRDSKCVYGVADGCGNEGLREYLISNKDGVISDLRKLKEI